MNFFEGSKNCVKHDVPRSVCAYLHVEQKAEPNPACRCNDALHELVTKLDRINRALSGIDYRRLVYTVTPQEYQDLERAIAQQSLNGRLEVRGCKKGPHAGLFVCGWKIEPTYKGADSESYYTDRRLPRG